MNAPMLDGKTRPGKFLPTALRLVRRLRPQRTLVAAVLTLSLGGIAIGVAGPRILGHAYDLVTEELARTKKIRVSVETMNTARCEAV